MPVPTTMTWSTSALAAANTALLTLLAGGSLKLRDASDTELASLPLANPAGAVDPATGVAVVSAGAGVVSAVGSAAYAQLCSSTGVAHCALPCVTGQSPESGSVALNSLTMLVGSKIESITIALG